MSGEGVRAVDSTWVSMGELRSVNWDERSDVYSDYVCKYDSGGGLSRWIAQDRECQVVFPDGVDEIKLDDGCLYRRRKVSRRDLWSECDFGTLIDVMECLAKRYGDDGVRWIQTFLED